MPARGLLRGRDRDVAAVLGHLSAGVRIVTLTGMPGVGRSAVARQVAATIEESAPGSVVTLDPRQLVGLDPATATFAGAARVVVIDGADHLGDVEGAGVAPIAEAELQVLVVARSPLRLPGERVVRIEPFPPVESRTDPAQLLHHPAVQLFTDVAEAVGASVSTDVAAIGEVCNLLGGVPLAIELAAARTPAFAPATIRDLVRTSSIREVLAGRTSAPPAEPDLFAAISWSESLLDPAQRTLLRELSCFRGPATVESIAAVVGRADLVDDLSKLVDVHLLDVHHDVDGSRFWLHPLVREHVSAALESATPDRAATLRDRHVAWAAHVARSSAEEDGPGSGHASVQRLGPLEADLLHAFETASSQGRTVDAATIAIGLAPLWLAHGASTARVRDVQALCVALEQAGDSPVLPVLLGWVALLHAEAAATPDQIAEVVSQAVAAVEAAGGEPPPTVLRVVALAVQAARVVDERQHVAQLCAQGRTLAREAGDDRALVWFEVWSGMLAQQVGRVEEAVEWALAALARARTVDDPALLITTAGFLRTLPPGSSTDVALPSGGDLVDAARRADDHRALAWLLPLAALEALRAGDLATAARHDVDLLALAVARGQWQWCGAAFMNLALVAVARQEDDRAARLHGMLERHLPVLRNSLPPWAFDGYERSVSRMRRSLGSRFDTAAGHGAALGLSAAAAEASAYAVSVAGIESEEGVDDDPLTARQHEILSRLVAGDSNKQISLMFGISPKTVMHHTSNIYRKLEVRGRAEAVAWAVRRTLPANGQPA